MRYVLCPDNLGRAISLAVLRLALHRAASRVASGRQNDRAGFGLQGWLGGAVKYVSGGGEASDTI